jgi:hypothetical protein
MEEWFNRLLGMNTITGFNLALDHDPVKTQTGISSRQVKEMIRKKIAEEQK